LGLPGKIMRTWHAQNVRGISFVLVERFDLVTPSTSVAPVTRTILTPISGSLVVPVGPPVPTEIVVNANATVTDISWSSGSVVEGQQLRLWWPYGGVFAGVTLSSGQVLDVEISNGLWAVVGRS
jgi:hypothetical protein